MENEKQLAGWMQPPTCAHVKIRLRGCVLFLICTVVFIIYILINQEGAVLKAMAAFGLTMSSIYLGFNIYYLPECVSIRRVLNGSDGGNNTQQ